MRLIVKIDFRIGKIKRLKICFPTHRFLDGQLLFDNWCSFLWSFRNRKVHQMLYDILSKDYVPYSDALEFQRLCVLVIGYDESRTHFAHFRSWTVGNVLAQKNRFVISIFFAQHHAIDPYSVCAWHSIASTFQKCLPWKLFAVPFTGKIVNIPEWKHCRGEIESSQKSKVYSVIHRFI